MVDLDNPLREKERRFSIKDDENALHKINPRSLRQIEAETMKYHAWLEKDIGGVPSRG